MQTKKSFIKVKRIYEPPAKDDGMRILVDRLWPRGLTKEKAQIDLWLKEIAPSNELRKWSHQSRERWNEFRERYFVELDANQNAVTQLLELVKEGPITLLFAVKDLQMNNAIVLKEYLEARMT